MIPVATSTYTVIRPSNLQEDSFEPQTWTTVKSGVRGVFSYPSGNEVVLFGHRERIDGKVILDEYLPVYHFDQLVDEVTGQKWLVSGVQPRQGLGLDHTVVGVYATEGMARGTSAT